MSGVGGSKEKIGRLQELLERVQMRARLGATTEGGYAAASHAASAPAHEAPAAQTSPPPAAYNEREGEMSAAPPTPAYATAPPATEMDYDIDSEVEVSSEVVEVDIDIDEAEVEAEPMALESGAQPVGQQTMPPEELDEEQPMATQPSVRPPAESREEEIAHAAPPANEIEEPTPSSSRRPIAGEEASAEAYEPESSPRHTPPPESGKQVAAPSAHPPSRKPSAPPPSLEGHTLIGGWREPGLGTPQISPHAGMSAGVRVPAPGVGPGIGPGVGPGPELGRGPSGTEPPATVVQGAGAIAAQVSGTRLTADVTRPDLASGANVASFTGAPAIERPKTLGELLDLSLGL